jgi:DNA polymerase-3 subunit gamma/tau
MVLLRIVHAADLPDPAALIARLQGQGESPVSAPAPRPAPATTAVRAEAPQPAPALPDNFRALVSLLEGKGKPLRAVQLHGQVGLIRYAAGELALKPLQPLGSSFARDLEGDLRAVTGASWRVTLGDGEAEPSLAAQDKMDEERARDAILREPSVAAVLSAFPDATLESVSAKDTDHA